MQILIDLKILSTEGKNYKWERPKCPNGCKKVWGHGYVLRYFAHFLAGLYLKRWRCPTCKIVILMFPVGYWKGYQTSIENIFIALKNRIKSYCWPINTSRQRGGHWLRKFISLVRMEYGDDCNDLLAILKNLYSKNIPFLV